VAINRFRMQQLKSDRLEIEMAYVHKVIASDLGYFINGAIS